MVEEKKQDFVLDLSIKRIKDTAFFINESALTPGQNSTNVNFEHKVGLNLEKNLFDFCLVVSYRDIASNELLIQIEVQNVFQIGDLRTFITTDNDPSIVNLPAQALITIVSLSISHTRALLAKNIAGTVFNDIILPIVNPSEVTKTFFQPNEKQTQD